LERELEAQRRMRQNRNALEDADDDSFVQHLIQHGPLHDAPQSVIREVKQFEKVLTSAVLT
jgi:hypothetical protein